jgi:hypothetical protein
MTILEGVFVAQPNSTLSRRERGYRGAKFPDSAKNTSRDAIYSGMFPCFFFGIAARLPSRNWNAAMRRGRVSEGSMMSST